MGRIFISYRREDTMAHAGRLGDALRRRFGADRVFMDMEAIEPGADFVDAIDDAIDDCEALIVLIGDDWLTVTGDDGRPRLEDEEDFVRIEVAAALERKARVFPVLVEGASMPSADQLPASLAKLARRQAHELAEGKRWHTDVAELVSVLERIPDLAKASASRPRTSEHRIPEAPVEKKKSRVGLIAALAAGFVGLLIVVGNLPDDEGDGVASQPLAQLPVAPIAVAVPPSAGPSGYSPDVQQAQRLLAQLGYAPGPADGLLGRGTISAVRDFQDSNGYRVDGRVTPMLLDQLAEMVDEEQAWAAPSPVQALDLSGTWYDDQGSPLQILQQGGAIEVYGVDPMFGTPFPIAAGQVQGGQLSVAYTNAAGVSGTVQASLAPDGRHLNGTDTNALTGQVMSATWHREHLPGQ